MKAKKSLGQNFLNSTAALGEIIEAADLEPKDLVLEVGPGQGILTRALLDSGSDVIALEKDDRLIAVLNEKFKSEIGKHRLLLIHKDILDFNEEDTSLISKDYKIVANIPYYITGAFVRKFLTSKLQPDLMVLLLQKEVTERIVAKDKKESILSISVKAYGKPKYIKTVKAGSFSPAPKVDSAILLIDDISRKFFHDNKINEEKFFELVKTGFGHKRKMLLGNLRSLSKEGRDEISWKEKFRLLKIPEKARAEDLSIENWKDLARYGA